MRVRKFMARRHSQISENLKGKAKIDRVEMISRLNKLRNYFLYRLHVSINGKLNILTQLYMALDNLSIPKSSSLSQEKLIKHKLNFQMQHKMKNLAQEKNLLRDINVSHERNNDSTLRLEELSNSILWDYQFYHDIYKQNKCEKLDEEIKQFQVTGKISKGLRETVRNQVKVICDELIETRKKKRDLEDEIKVIEKELWP
ncbi:hypothetical protein QN277_023377 [Acacia crassicarpa]|uniref:Uncharacterized protein n=1 Tax=Acacia crassicarpa TaxID=499986 RepID=A0AAE1JH54_9FABA|nr:hypothetical protein QN277_023377 [Acacia crassicarpa]